MTQKKEIITKYEESVRYDTVHTYIDKDGKEITISAAEYFGKIDVSTFGQKVVANFQAAFGPLLEMLQGDDEESYPLDDAYLR